MTKIMQEAMNLINSFCLFEYGEEANFSNLQRVSIGYTTTEDDLHELQAYVDLWGMQMIICIDNEIAYIRKYPTLRELIDCELNYLDFDDMFDIPDEVLDVFYERCLRKGRHVQEAFRSIGKDGR